MIILIDIVPYMIHKNCNNIIYIYNKHNLNILNHFILVIFVYILNIGC